jgi:pyruvate/2-oxoglutarate dehydrogenase complex dihydrolipoamide acyltransferase (E2) component
MASSGIVEIQMPQMGESVTEGTVLEWHKQEGEFVEEGDTVVEVSTDKVDAEVPAPASGTITKILKGEDETIEVGGVLAELDPSAAPSGDGASAETPAKETSPETAEGGDVGASGEAAVQTAEPAGQTAPEPAASAGEAEEGGGVMQEASGGLMTSRTRTALPARRRPS